MSTREDDAGSDSFAAMFEAESRNKPRRVARDYSPGQPVEGTVIRVGKDAVFVELDGKREGYIEATEMRDHDGNVTVTVGETVRAMVIHAEGDGAIRLGKAAPKGRGAEGLMRAREAGLSVEGMVTGVNKGGLEVTIDGVRAFCPARAVDNKFVAELEPFVGQKLKFLVTSVKEGGREVVLSRRALLDQEAQEARAKIADKLVVGAVLEGKVTSTRDFGAFVDLGGVEGLLPASELSHDRSMRPADMVKVGDALQVQVLKIEDDEKRKGQQKITLSLKALAADPWESIAPTLAEESVHSGRVMRLAAFGAFVQIAPGLDGLLHVSELSGEMTPEGAPVLPKVGDTISVRVLKVDLAQRRIALAPSDAPARTGEAPKAKRAPAASLQQGSVVTGKVTGVERFGVFVQIDGVNARGLIPAQELSKVRGADLSKILPMGSDVRAKVVAIDAQGKIRLSMQAAKEDDERATFEDFRAKEQDRASGAGMGALGQKLAQAGLLGKKK